MPYPFLRPLVFTMYLGALLATSSTASEGAIEGKWLGTAGLPSNPTVFGLEIKRDGEGHLLGFVTLEQLNYYGARLPAFEDVGNGKFRIPAFGIELTLTGERLAGTLSGGAAPVELRRTTALPSDPPVPTDLPVGPGPRWQTKLGAAIYASAAVSDGMAYVGTVGGVFQAIKVADGSLAWTFSAGRPIFAEALVTEDAVYFACDNGFLFKLARADGKELWRYELGDAGSSRILPHPQVYDYDYQASRPARADGVLFIGSGDDSFHAIREADGARVWRIRTPGKVRTDPAIVGPNVVFATAGGAVEMVDRATGNVVWRKDHPAPLTSSPVLMGDRLILGGRDSQLQAVDIRDGSQLWRLGFWGSWVESTPTAANDRFYLGSSDLRRVGCYDPSDGRIVWRTDVFGWSWGRPAVTARHVYAATGGVKPYDIRHVAGLCALDRETGRMVWRWPFTGGAGEFHWGFAGSPALSGETLVIGGLDGTLYGFPVEP